MTDTPLCVADVLERAADLIEPEGAWTQGAYARDAKGRKFITGRAEGMVCFCAIGAIDHVTNAITPLWKDALTALQQVLPESRIGAWNDAPERTQPEVVAALRRAATLARAGDA
jgi:hypothetical protein